MLGWKGIEVWSVLVSIGVPAVLRAIFQSIFHGWTWYDQLLLFGGAFLAILGILAFVFGKRIQAKGERRNASTSSSNSKSDLGASIPASLTPQFHNPLDDAIARLAILSRDFSGLAISRGIAGWPVQYSIRLYNTRPVSIEVVAYRVTILLGGIPVQVVSWDKLSSDRTSNGISQSPIRLAPDSLTTFRIPVVLALMQSSLPQTSPFWGATGELRLRGDKEVVPRTFNFINDNYMFSQTDWDALRQNAFPK